MDQNIFELLGLSETSGVKSPDEDISAWVNFPGNVHHFGYNHIAVESAQELINVSVTSNKQEVFQKTVNLKPDQLNLVYFSDREL